VQNFDALAADFENVRRTADKKIPQTKACGIFPDFLNARG